MDYQKKNKLGFVIVERKFVCKRKLSVIGFCWVLNLTGWLQLNSSVHVSSKTTAEFCFAHFQVFFIIAATENSASSSTSGTNQMLLACSIRPEERERERASFINKPQKTHLGFGGERESERVETLETLPPKTLLFFYSFSSSNARSARSLMTAAASFHRPLLLHRHFSVSRARFLSLPFASRSCMAFNSSSAALFLNTKHLQALSSSSFFLAGRSCALNRILCQQQTRTRLQSGSSISRDLSVKKVR